MILKVFNFKALLLTSFVIGRKGAKLFQIFFQSLKEKSTLVTISSIELSSIKNFGMHRRLAHAVLHPRLDDFQRPGTVATNDVQGFHERYGDLGASQFFVQTRIDVAMGVPVDRPTMVQYLSFDSPKLQALAVLARDVCITHGRKLIVFCDWPMTQWLAGLFLTNLDFNVIGIRSTHSTTALEEAVVEFNDPASNVQILVMSLRISSTAVNLQDDCSNMVFLDCPTNAQIALQAGGRTLRIGQTRTCIQYVIVLDLSYDQIPRD